MFDHIIQRCKDEDVQGVLYKLVFAKKFIIVKGKTLAGSLHLIRLGYQNYRPEEQSGTYNHLYKHFYAHLKDGESGKVKGRLNIKILRKLGKNVSHYDLLRTEQDELDKHRYNSDFLGNDVEAYIPKWNESAAMYGWIPKMDVMRFKSYLTSPARKQWADMWKAHWQKIKSKRELVGGKPVLQLVLIEEWYKKIEYGFKKEEYRALTKYWSHRFSNDGKIKVRGVWYDAKDVITCFSHGYKKDRRQMFVECEGLRVGYGDQDWGAMPNTKYYILKLGKIIKS